MLTLRNIEVIYSKVILVIKGLTLQVPEGGVVALLGANGAGKSTTLKSIAGLLGPERGGITKGLVEFDGQRINDRTPAEIVKRGIAMVPEGRQVFEHLTAEENLMVGAHTRRNTPDIRRDIERVYQYFPPLAARRRIEAGYLSGGEQQMLAIGRALMSRPKLMLLDEPSLGLAPMLVEEIFEIIARLNREEKVTVLLVEQNAAMALTIAQYGYILENGRIVLDGTAASLRDNEDVKEFYLGLSEIGRRSYRDVKHYRRRKRWLL
ncbi:MAG: ABC transporter ATP-binding protein [Nitrospinae bacterium]|nr:ABC transporter ATP-binding protein [Nitrospinota bacterium]